MTVILLGIAGAGLIGMLALAGFDVVRRPGLRRLAVRNVLRRPGEAALVVIGSMLGTAIVTAAFVVGDSLEASIGDIARRELGPVDEQVRVEGLDGLDEIAPLVEEALSERTELVDGTLTVRSAAATIAGTSRDGDRRAEPAATVAEVDFGEARAFGDDPGATGLAAAGPTPSGEEVVVNERIGRSLGVAPGDTVELFAYGGSRELIVRDVLDEVGLAGYATAFVDHGTISALAGRGTAPGTAPPTSEILVSNTGGVYAGADHSEAVTGTLEAAVAGAGAVEVRPVKADLLEEAETSGESVSQLFSSIGAFSVLVGILLLVNLFVMLAEERKQELGVLRAVGLKRSHLLRAFSIEGGIYSVLAALTGGGVGIGVGWAIGRVTESIITADDPDFAVVTAVEPASILTGILVGLVISLLTVWLTSARIARLDVICAIRDLPPPRSAAVRLRSMVLSAAGAVLGLLLVAGGLATESAVPTLAGPCIALLSSIVLVRPIVGPRLAVTGLGLASLAWGLGVFSLAPDAMESAGIEVFVVQGVVLVASAVLLLSSGDRLWLRLTGLLVRRGRGLSAHVALAHPLARKVRTGMLLAMFSLIVFTMTFLSVFTEIFGEQAGDFADRAGGGFDLYVDSSPTDPVGADELGRAEGVTAVAPLLRAVPQFTAPFEHEPTPWTATGFDRSLLAGGAPELSSRAPGLESDREVYEAVLAGDDRAIVPDFFLQGEGGPPEGRVHVGETVTMYDPASEATLELEVAGVTDSDFVLNGVMVGRDTLASFLSSGAVGARSYVAVADGTDPAGLAARLDGRLLEHGVRAESFLDAVEAELSEQQGFFRLMQGYLGLGLVIGIAGLGVVMVRAVRERRRQVGMLRAMGFPAATVRGAFLLEAGFVAVQGVLVGIGLGLLTAHQVLADSTAFGDRALPFAVPWSGLAVILLAPLAASLLATVAPAAQAARIRPAAALRISD